MAKLAAQKWTPCSVHEVYLAFLIAERGAFAGLPNEMLSLIDKPDLNDREQNSLRVHVLYAKREQLLGEVPVDTSWFRVENLSDDALDELRVIARCSWDSRPDEPQDRNELRRVARRRPQTLREPDPTKWAPLILWGHEQSGPFTIIEGNNRLTAYASAAAPVPFSIPVYVGLSTSLFCFHLDDPPIMMLHPFWKP